MFSSNERERLFFSVDCSKLIWSTCVICQMLIFDMYTLMSGFANDRNWKQGYACGMIWVLLELSACHLETLSSLV